MSKIGNYVQGLIEQGVISAENPTNAPESDYIQKAKDYMAKDEYEQEHAAKEKLAVDNFIDSVKEYRSWMYITM